MTEESLFAAALEIIDADEQAAFLDSACGGDPALRRRVATLLAAHVESGRFLEPFRHELTGEPVSVGRPDVPTTIAPSIGSAPRLLLRDAETEDSPSAIIRSASLRMPATAGRLQLFGEIARGGIGTVFMGRDNDLGRELAVKVLLERHRDEPTAVHRFIEEAQIGGQLQHPGIVPVYELGSFEDRRPYFAMKLVRGRTLAELLRARATPADDLPRFLGIFAQVCQTIAYAHARGVIHRDLKPSNVMVGAFGEVQVMDWGLAKVLTGGTAAGAAPIVPPAGENGIRTVRSGSDAEATDAGKVLGTPAYIAPEQARGEVGLINERVDVFGLAAILCELLTGLPPFRADSSHDALALAMRGDLSAALVRLDSCGADGELRNLARRGLAADPEERFPSAGALAGEMTRYLEGVQERLKTSELTRVEAQARAEGEAKRRRLAVGLAAALVGMMVSVGGGGGYLAWQHRDRAARADRTFHEAERLLADAVDAGTDPARWASARAAATQVERTLADARDDATRARARRLLGEVDDQVKKANQRRALLDELVDIRSARYDDWDRDDADFAYTRAFRSAGLDIDAIGPREAAARLKNRPAAELTALVAALDDWALVRGERPDSITRRQALVAAARIADPDPIRDTLRQTLLSPGGTTGLRQLNDLAATADLETWPPASLVLLATSLENARDRTAGVRVLRRAAIAHPGDVWVHYVLGGMLADSVPSQPEEAIRAYTVARALRPETAHELAHALEGHGRTEEALAIFHDLTTRRPGNVRHRTCYVLLLQHQGRAETAAVALRPAVAIGREAVRLRPGDSSPHFELGRALRLAGKLGEAEAEFGESLRLDPHSGITYCHLAKTLRDQGRFAEAAESFRQAFRHGHDNANDHLDLGDILCERLNDTIGAEAEYRKAVQIEPENAAAQCNLGLALRRQGKGAAAAAALRESIRLDPRIANSHFQLGAVLCDQLADYPGAEAESREAVRLDPQDPEAHCNLGHALRKLGRLAEALTEFRRGHELGAQRPGWQYPSARWVRECEELIASGGNPPAALAKKDVAAAALAHPAAEPPQAPPDDVEGLLKALRDGDRTAFRDALVKLQRQLDPAGPEAEAAARRLLGRKADVVSEPGVAHRLDLVLNENGPVLAAQWLLQIAKARQTVISYKKGHVVVGRLLIEDGKTDPELVMAQMPILPEGYFAGEVGDLVRPLAFRAHGYQVLDVSLEGTQGKVVDVGTVTLKPLPKDEQAALKGKVRLDDPKQSGATRARLSVAVGPINTPHNGYSPRRRWPAPIDVAVSAMGEFAAKSLSPCEYSLTVEARGHVRSWTSLNLKPGEEVDAGTIELRSENLGFYIGKPAPNGPKLAWEKEFPTALEKARAERKPLLLMMTATWCGPCHMLEDQTLSDPWIRQFLSAFVLVKAYEDKDVEKTYGLNGYPTLVFIDSSGKAAFKTVGYQPPLSFAGECVHAYQRLSLDLPADLQALVDRRILPTGR